MMVLPLPSSLDIRNAFLNMVYGDLIGPAGGAEEQVTEATVRSRYIVGMLAPNNHSPILTSPDELGEIAIGGTEDDQDGKSEPPIYTVFLTL
jgi:hypothetical protein